MGRAGRYAALAALGAVATPVVAFLWLLIAPIPVGFLIPSMERGLSQTAGMPIEIGDATITWYPTESRVAVTLYDVIVRGGDGASMTEVPKARVGFAVSALLEGKFAPRRVTLTGLSATVVRKASGGFRLGLAPVGEAAAAAAPAPAPVEQSVAAPVIAAMLAPPDEAQLSTYLERVAIEGARIEILDEATGTRLVAPDAALTLERGDKGVTGEVNAAVEIDGGTWPIAARAAYTRGADAIALELGLSELVLSKLVTAGSLFEPLRGANIPVAGTLAAELGLNGRLGRITAGLDMGAGRLELPGLDSSAAEVTSGTLSAQYDPASGDLFLETLELNAKRLAGTFSGQGRLVLDASGAVSEIVGAIAGDNLSLNWPETFAGPVALDHVALRGAADFALGLYTIENAALRQGAFEAVASGEIIDGAASPAIRVDATLTDIEIRQLVAIWPLTAGDGARDWLDRNAFAGMIPKAVLRMDVPEGAFDAEFLPDEMMRLDFNFEGLEANYLTGLTHITEGKGQGTLFADTFNLSVESGKVGPIAITGGNVHIGTLHIPRGPGDFKARARGQLKDILALIDKEPLGYPTKFGIDPKTVDGEATIDIALVIPLRKELSVDEISFDIDAKAKGFGLPIRPDLKLSQGDATFEVTGDRLIAEGTARIGDTPLSIKWRENFKGEGDPTEIAIEGQLDDAARARFGVDVPRHIQGPVVVSATLKGRGVALRSGRVDLDLSRARIAVPELGWSKAPGASATATFALKLTRGGVLTGLENFTLTGDGIAATGSLTLSPEGAMTKAVFPRIVLGPGNDFALTIEQAADATRLDFKGASIDVGGAMERMLEKPDAAERAEAGEAPTPLDIKMAVDKLILREGASLDNVTFTMRRTGVEAMTLALAGRSKGREVTVAIKPDGPNRRRVTASSPDAGLMLRGVFGFESMVGGALTLDAVIEGTGKGETMEGDARVKDFRIVDQPFLARLFAAGSLTGIGDLLSGQGIAFKTLHVPFRRTEEEWRLLDARANGDAIGVTAEGRIGRGDDDVNIAGTLVPIYGINSILEGIPVIGDLLMGREGEGILGVTYAVRGGGNELNITVNPLAAVAPGILRRIFEFDASGPSAQGEKPPVATP